MLGLRPSQTIQCSTPNPFLLAASPKAISERTSYYQVRLAFHSLPQLIRAFCTTHRFGPPLPFRARFILAKASSPGFGFSSPFSLVLKTSNALLTLAFALPSPCRLAGLKHERTGNSLAHSSIGTTSHCATAPCSEFLIFNF